MEALEGLRSPRAVDGSRALRFDGTRVQALLAALAAFRPFPKRLNNRTVHEHLAPLRGREPDAFSQGRMTYDLRCLRLGAHRTHPAHPELPRDGGRLPSGAVAAAAPTPRCCARPRPPRKPPVRHATAASAAPWRPSTANSTDYGRVMCMPLEAIRLGTQFDSSVRVIQPQWIQEVAIGDMWWPAGTSSKGEVTQHQNRRQS